MASPSFEIMLGRARHPLVLALDVGSTASRGAIYDANGSPVRPRAKVPHAFTTRADGTSIIDPDQIVREVTQLIDQLVDLTVGHPVAAVSLDTFASSLVGVDAQGAAVTPCFNYNDNRCADEVALLRAEVDEDRIQALTGCRFHASYLPARLRWLARTEPATVATVTRWMSLGEYVWLRLLGDTAAGTSVAAWGGLLNRHTGQWAPAMLELAGITEDQLNRIADPADGLSPQKGSKARKLWPSLKQAHWCAPIGDGYAATCGIGDASGSPVISLATSGAMRMLVDDPVGTGGLDLPRGLWSYRVDSQHSLIGGAVNDVGRATEWMMRELRLPDDAIVAAQLHEPPSAITPLVLPFFTGERSTGWVGSARATLHNVDFSTSALELYRGVLEGIVWSFQRIIDQLVQVGGPIASARVGGRVAAEAPGLLTVMADGLSLELVAVNIKRSTLLGNARIALDVVASGIERTAVQTAAALRPDPHCVEFYDRRQLQLDRLYEAVVRSAQSAVG